MPTFRDVVDALAVVFLVLCVLVAAWAIWRGIAFDFHCSDIGGHSVAAGRGHALCLNSDGRIIDSL